MWVVVPLGHRAQSRARSPVRGPRRSRARSSAAPRSGRNTRNDAPPPARSSTHARPPWSSANRATSESPMPVPGGVARDGRSLAERLEDRLAQVVGDAGPVVLDGDERARRPAASTRTQIDESVLRVPDRVHHEVLDDPLDLRGVDVEITTSSVSTVDVAARAGSRLSSVRRASAPTSVGAVLGVTMPRESRSMSRRSAAAGRACGRSCASRPGGRRVLPRDPAALERERTARGSTVSGLRSSWETAARKVFFISSSARRRSAASRSRRSDVTSASSASLRSVTSYITPWKT